MKNARKCLVGLLVIISMIAPAAGTRITGDTPLPRGSTLYVGGSGPGNYTRIQDAINASTDGDTVFVYDDAAPYHETLSINTSISLVGEATNTTVLDGNHSIAVLIWVLADNVQIRNFTVKNAIQNIIVCADDVTISQTAVSDANMGINLKVFWLPVTQRERIRLLNNRISRTYIGIMTEYRCNDSTFQSNIIEDNDFGMVLYGCCHNRVLLNTFRNNSREGIHDSYGVNNSITTNTFVENSLGLEINCSSADRVERNTFLGNERDAMFAKLPYWELNYLREARYFNESYVLRYYRPFGSTTWDANYWNASLTHPYLVRGWSLFQSRSPRRSHVPRVEVDWHPALQPYKISA